MKPLLGISALLILLLMGAASLSPSMLSGLPDSVAQTCSSLLPKQRGSNERAAGTALKMLASAQADFRANDRDGDGVNQFWRGDVAGLYTLPSAAGAPIQLISLDVAASDDRPRTNLLIHARQRPRDGYWVRAIRHADETPGSLDPQRFAFCAFPVNPSAGGRIIIIDENNSMFSCPADRSGGILVFPSDQERQAKWSRFG